MSPPGAGLFWLLISGITIKITTYVLLREVEVDLSRSDIDDLIGRVEERSSKDDRYIFFFSHVKDYEISRDIVILYSYHNVFCIPSRNWIDWSAICNCIYVRNKGLLRNK